MLDKQLLEQYAELMGDDGVQDMYAAFADNIGGYLNHLQWLVKQRQEQELRNQAHKIKGACRSVGLRQLAQTMEKLERAEWQWQDVEHELAKWEAELPIHQHQIEAWLKARRIE
ncbi:Aerobic respiration control sensor protein ArcB [Pseudidiomarina piscicola]|uniref:Aerobic respiration control sensor protein ArcB n=1 Tax=Pseudidiomarina piscicola TaxID=2614830 RepID=A0A6S6WUW7_9GAMM|nr:Hpt domain-containing protein [Pseudidiomarina piscicola]CAB0151094.1 Aerobic respiration control sensor protein ArcB [Pseudidiomarina piscicola]VZT40602.1 Aerobic respiration control sensor protein ArcB [Pseudomonas aeruginosa]